MKTAINIRSLNKTEFYMVKKGHTENLCIVRDNLKTDPLWVFTGKSGESIRISFHLLDMFERESFKVIIIPFITAKVSRGKLG